MLAIGAEPLIAQAVAKGSTSATGNPFPAINTGMLWIVIVLLSLLLTWQFRNRKLTTQVNGELRKEFIDEMNALRADVKSLRTENEQLRNEVRNLNEIITGMSRGEAQSHRSAQAILAELLPTSPQIDRAMKSLGNIDGDKRS